MMRIPVIVLSGFLGSGKTTFLKYLLKNSKKKFGLIINEFGDVGIDGDLIKDCESCSATNDECIIELNNGCLCCTVQDDFVPSIKALLKSSREIDYIIIETSGLALPIPLIVALQWPELKASVYLDLVIGIVNGESMLNGSPINDLSTFKNQFEETQFIEHNSSIEELFEEQMEAADIVLISRSDLLKDNQYEHVKKLVIKKIKPETPIIRSYNGQINLDYLFNSNLERFNHQINLSEEHSHKHPELVSGFIKLEYFLGKHQFEKEITLIINDLRILRIKGRIWIPGKSLPLQIQIVGKKVSTWFEQAPNDCWHPLNGGLEFVVISFDEESISILESKIKDKFNILNDHFLSK